MIFDLEERVEDAMAAYLRTTVGGMRIYEAWNFTDPEYPCAIVYSGETSPVSDGAQWHLPRDLKVEVSIQTEAAPETQGGVVIRTARERNAQARSSVIGALSRIDLPDAINATSPERVLFSMAQISRAVRSVDGRTLATVIHLDVIAQPTEA